MDDATLTRRMQLTAQLRRAVDKRSLEGWRAQYVLGSLTAAEYRRGSVSVNDDATGFTVTQYDLRGQRVRSAERKTLPSALLLVELWSNGLD